jgi:hypothetical protein
VGIIAIIISLIAVVLVYLFAIKKPTAGEAA